MFNIYYDVRDTNAILKKMNEGKRPREPSSQLKKHSRVYN